MDYNGVLRREAEPLIECGVCNVATACFVFEAGYLVSQAPGANQEEGTKLVKRVITEQVEKRIVLEYGKVSHPVSDVFSVS